MKIADRYVLRSAIVARIIDVLIEQHCFEGMDEEDQQHVIDEIDDVVDGNLTEIGD